VTLTLFPPTSTLAVRLDEPVFAATLKATEPLPDPLPAVIVIQFALVNAVHEQPVPAVTVMLATSPPPAIV
jgi:hypothetical protein